MNEPLVSIQIVVRDGRRHIRHCLNAVAIQTYPNIEVVVLDNASSDDTADIVQNEYPQYRLVRHSKNLGMWPGQELLLSRSAGTYVVALSVDVIIEKDFVANAVAACQANPAVAGVQAKIYQYDIGQLEREGESVLKRTILDTCGFALTKSRKVVNIGHGDADGATYDLPKQILGVEGAVPFFRRQALEDSRIDGRLVDPDYFWYGDDLDLAWRMTLLGHQQMFIPDVIAWHDRSTTKGTAHTPIIGQLSRLTTRAAIPLKKRRWDWSNVRFTIIKNDYIINILQDLPFIALRELMVFGYTLLFEPLVFLEVGRFLRLLPTMLRRRSLIMRHASVSAATVRQFFL